MWHREGTSTSNGLRGDANKSDEMVQQQNKRQPCTFATVADSKAKLSTLNDDCLRSICGFLNGKDQRSFEKYIHKERSDQ